MHHEEEETFNASVSATLPGNAKRRDISFDATFRYIEMDRYADLMDGVINPPSDATVKQIITARREAIEEVLVDVKITSKGLDIAPEDQRGYVVNKLPLLNAAWDSFVQEYTGAAAKNSKPSPRR